MAPFTVTTTGFPVSKVKAAGLPPEVHLHNNGDGTGTISGTPKTTASATTDAVTITASSKAGLAAQTFTLGVGPG